jgi:hypothetical protein
MTNQQHPITPSPELVEQWRNLPVYTDGKRKLIMVTLSTGKLQHIATQAAQWGSDQELEACVKWIAYHPPVPDDLRTARRPKPPSLKGQALIELGDVYNRNKIDDVTYDTIRLALEQLND